MLHNAKFARLRLSEVCFDDKFVSIRGDKERWLSRKARQCVRLILGKKKFLCERASGQLIAQSGSSDDGK